MKEITLETYAEMKKSKRNKIGVADKLIEFLNKQVSTLKKSVAYEIQASDFLGSDVKDFHYYGALKALKANYESKLDWDFHLVKNGRADKLNIKLK